MLGVVLFTKEAFSNTIREWSNSFFFAGLPIRQKGKLTVQSVRQWLYPHGPESDQTTNISFKQYPWRRHCS